MTPGDFEAILFGLSIASGAGLVVACVLFMPWVADEGSCPEDRRQAEQKGATLIRSWLSPEQTVLWGGPPQSLFLCDRLRHWHPLSPQA
jgi:hypothetical protein